MTLSSAAKHQNTRVVDRIWSGNIDNLEIHVPKPLSPPIFIHTSLAVVNPSCQVSLLVLHEKVHVKMLAFAMVCLSKLITSHSHLRGGQPLQPAVECILEELL